jgi:hypothetical protein
VNVPKIPVDLHPSGVAYVYTAEEMDRRILISGGFIGPTGPTGPPGITPANGVTGPTGPTGPAGTDTNVDGGEPDTVYGGADPIDAGEI